MESFVPGFGPVAARSRDKRVWSELTKIHEILKNIIDHLEKIDGERKGDSEGSTFKQQLLDEDGNIRKQITDLKTDLDADADMLAMSAAEEGGGRQQDLKVKKGGII